MLVKRLTLSVSGSLKLQVGGDAVDLAFELQPLLGTLLLCAQLSLFVLSKTLYNIIFISSPV